ncbi:hypothetical protein TNCV_789431 [Trichonephila clavipes]|nr:hypothetical protein TNCV_789431 [Trichonephila clavipes]
MPAHVSVSSFDCDSKLGGPSAVVYVVLHSVKSSHSFCLAYTKPSIARKKEWKTLSTKADDCIDCTSTDARAVTVKTLPSCVNIKAVGMKTEKKWQTSCNISIMPIPVVQNTKH